MINIFENYRINIYPNLKSSKLLKSIRLDDKDFLNYFVDNTTPKNKRPLFLFNNIINPLCDSRENYNITVSPFLILDIDTHNEQQQKGVELDGGLEHIQNILVNDKHSVLVAKTFSGLGLRCLYFVEGDYNICIDVLNEKEIENESHKQKIKHLSLIEHLKSLGLNNISSYIDNGFIKQSLGTVSIRQIIKFDLNINPLPISKNIPKYKPTEPNILNNIDVNTINDKTYTQFYDIMMNVSGETINDKEYTYKNGKYNNLKDLVLDYFSNYDYGRENISFWYMIRNLGHEQRTPFFNILKHYYPQQGHDNKIILNGLNCLSDFNTMIDKNFKQSNTGKQSTLKTFFRDSGIPILDCNFYRSKKGYDFFGYPYDKEYTIDKYFSEKKKELFEDFDNNNLCILSGPLGGGKTTLLFNYIIESKFKNTLFVGSKISMLEQHFNKFSELSGEEINVYKNYTSNNNTGKKIDEIINNNNDNIKNVVFSTINSLNKLNIIPDLVVFDECHLLTDFDSIQDYKENYKLIYTYLSNNYKSIYISGTPEKFRLTLDNRYTTPLYINVNYIEEHKQEMTIYETTNKTEKLLYLVQNNTGDTTNIVFYNNYEGLKNIITKLSGNTSQELILISSQNKNDIDVYNIIKDEYILTGKTYLCTSYISEGINILNTEKIDIFIYDNKTVDFSSIYQFVNRFRKKNIKVSYITNFFTGNKYIEDYSLFDFRTRIEQGIDSNINLESDIEKDSQGVMLYPQIVLSNGSSYINTFHLTSEILKDFFKTLNSNKYYKLSYIQHYFSTTNIYSLDGREEVYRTFTKERLKEGRNIWEEKDILKNNYILGLNMYPEYKTIFDLFRKNSLDFETTNEKYNLNLNRDIIYKIRSHFCKQLSGEVLIYLSKTDSKKIVGGEMKMKKKEIDLLSKYVNSHMIEDRKENYIFISDVYTYMNGEKFKHLNLNDKKNIVNSLGMKKKDKRIDKKKYDVLVKSPL